MSLPSTNHTVQPEVHAFFEPVTNTFSYVVRDPASNHAAIIDSVLNFDFASGNTDTHSADEIIDHVHKHGLTIDWIIETHAHADHLSAAPYLKEKLGGQVGIGHRITEVQKVFADVFHVADDVAADGSQFDHLFTDGERYSIGHITAQAMATPGHTPACMSHIIGDAVFVGDTLFMPDSGTARADFPGGDAATLYQSVRKLLELPENLRLFMCHDYGTDGRDVLYETTVGEQKRHNIHVRDGISEATFIQVRNKRDATLGMPKLILPSLQVNIRAGHLPKPEANGQVYLKWPVNAFKKTSQKPR